MTAQSSPPARRRKRRWPRPSAPRKQRLPGTADVAKLREAAFDVLRPFRSAASPRRGLALYRSARADARGTAACAGRRTPTRLPRSARRCARSVCRRRASSWSMASLRRNCHALAAGRQSDLSRRRSGGRPRRLIAELAGGMGRDEGSDRRAQCRFDAGWRRHRGRAGHQARRADPSHLCDASATNPAARFSRSAGDRRRGRLCSLSEESFGAGGRTGPDEQCASSWSSATKPKSRIRRAH